ncbi:MAG: rhamnulokinase family protein, partial [Atopobiaceae bacterium]|nr:rhamnulokinase family protein [Atopobiaceae bacterium]
MEPSACHLAVDIGASSGRHIVGRVVDGRMELTEVYRFENGLTHRNGHLCWDIDALAEEVVRGLAAAKAAGFEPATIGIDTWAVDYVLLDERDQRIGDVVGYRDARTDGVRDALELAGILSFDEHYARTGIQYQQFNTAYQLCALSREDRAELDSAKALLMVPDYLNWVLTGEKAQEYTNASTTGLVNAQTFDWDDELIDRLNLPWDIFQPIRMPGESLGRLRPEVAERVGYDAEVVLVASHDTGSAWLAVPARDEKAVYFSSGTWSLVGVERREPICTPQSAAANFTNEGGYERRYRYLKNIMGLWMIQNVRRELGDMTGTAPSWNELVAAAEDARARGFHAVVDADDPEFLAPASMLAALRDVCARSGQPVPNTMGEYALVVYDSLADDYARTVAQLRELTGTDFTSINIVGGGSNNGYLNQATADACGLPVFAGPTEGTALGNLMVQFICGGEYASLEEARAAIKKSFEIKEYLP